MALAVVVALAMFNGMALPGYPAPQYVPQGWLGASPPYTLAAPSPPPVAALVLSQEAAALRNRAVAAEHELGQRRLELAQLKAAANDLHQRLQQTHDLLQRTYGSVLSWRQ